MQSLSWLTSRCRQTCAASRLQLLNGKPVMWTTVFPLSQLRAISNDIGHLASDGSVNRHQQVVRQIDRLERMMPSGLLAGANWDFKALWRQIKTTGAAFKDVRFPTRDEHERAGPVCPNYLSGTPARALRSAEP